MRLFFWRRSVASSRQILHDRQQQLHKFAMERLLVLSFHGPSALVPYLPIDDL
jgi:hypothetical protein